MYLACSETYTRYANAYYQTSTKLIGRLQWMFKRFTRRLLSMTSDARAFDTHTHQPTIEQMCVRECVLTSYVPAYIRIRLFRAHIKSVWMRFKLLFLRKRRQSVCVHVFKADAFICTLPFEWSVFFLWTKEIDVKHLMSEKINMFRPSDKENRFQRIIFLRSSFYRHGARYYVMQIIHVIITDSWQPLNVP